MNGLILHVENDADDVFIVQRSLKNAGITNPVFHVEDGEQAMEYFQGQGQFSDRIAHPLPCLVFLDLSMPRMDGLEFLKWLRLQPLIKRTIVLVLTSSNNKKDISSAYDHGANGYLVKPISGAEFQSAFVAVKSFWLETNQS